MTSSPIFASWEPLGNAEKPDVTIQISAKVPDDANHKWFDGQASDLAYYLINALPQGTLERLTAHLMMHQARKTLLITKSKSDESTKEVLNNG